MDILFLLAVVRVILIIVLLIIELIIIVITIFALVVVIEVLGSLVLATRDRTVDLVLANSLTQTLKPSPLAVKTALLNSISLKISLIRFFLECSRVWLLLLLVASGHSNGLLLPLDLLAVESLHLSLPIVFFQLKSLIKFAELWEILLELLKDLETVLRAVLL